MAGLVKEIIVILKAIKDRMEKHHDLSTPKDLNLFRDAVDVEFRMQGLRHTISHLSFVDNKIYATANACGVTFKVKI